MVKGRRLPDDLDPYADGTAQPGDYWRSRGVWYCQTPSGDMGNLRQHKVTEHGDGTITVSPSILVTLYPPRSAGQEQYHGYLERGVWRGV
jgi:hypothetical protein